MYVNLTKAQLKYLHFLVKNEVEDEPEFINQREAFRRFGRSNVERWRNKGVIESYQRVRTVEYKLDQLREAAEIKDVIAIVKS